MSGSPDSESSQQNMRMSNVSPHDSDTESKPVLGQDEPAQPQKRKGGRKPIYATSEERKQRNREAQAAFRERRSGYIKELEVKLKQHEDTIHGLKQNQDSMANECSMLRYHNNMLERIIYEKGFDVHAELQARGINPMPQGQHAPAPATGAPIMQQAIMNRHQQVQQQHTPSLSTNVDPAYGGPSLPPHRVSPTSAVSNHTPSSSRYSSPATASAYHAPPMMDQRDPASMPHVHMQQGQHGPGPIPQSYSYGGYPVMMEGAHSGGQDPQSRPMDIQRGPLNTQAPPPMHMGHHPLQ